MLLSTASLRVQQVRKTEFWDSGGRGIHDASLLGVKIAGRQLDRIPHVAQRLDVDAEGPMAPDRDQGELSTVRDIELHGMIRQRRLAVLACFENESARLQVQVTPENDAQRSAACAEALTIALKAQARSPCLLARIQHIQARMRVGVDAQVHCPDIARFAGQPLSHGGIRGVAHELQLFDMTGNGTGADISIAGRVSRRRAAARACTVREHRASAGLGRNPH